VCVTPVVITHMHRASYGQQHLLLCLLSCAALSRHCNAAFLRASLTHMQVAARLTKIEKSILQGCLDAVATCAPCLGASVHGTHCRDTLHTLHTPAMHRRCQHPLLHCAMLCCAVLYRTMLRCAVLCCCPPPCTQQQPTACRPCCQCAHAPCASLQMLWLSARPHLQSSWLESASEFDSHQPHHTPLLCDDVV
jgi:hypothetical protein